MNKKTTILFVTLLVTFLVNSQNLLINGDAEIAPIVGNGWTQDSGNWTQRSSDPSPESGNNYFFAGANETAELFQLVDVSDNSVDIDAGRAAYQLTAFVCNFEGRDIPRISMSFLDVSGVTLRTSVSSSRVTSPHGWLMHEVFSDAPIGTRTIEVRLRSTRYSGTNNDGYIDNVQLIDDFTYVPDDNFKSSLRDLGLDTSSYGDYVLTSDISGVSSLSLSDKNISDLTGIEDFTSLQSLDCSNNSLMSLDVSANTLLEHLECNDNRLTHLDVSNGNNANISSSFFDATNNPVLTCIQVDDIAYSTSNWSNIDAPANFSEDCVLGSQNLIFNGSAETSPIVGNGWTQVSGDWVQKSSNPLSQDGNNYFFAGANETAELFQVVDVSANTINIDAGSQPYQFNAYLRSFSQASADQGQVIVEYLNASDAVLETYDSGLQTPTADWELFQDFRIAPVGTRSIKITLISIRNSGTNNDGYFDTIQLIDDCTYVPDDNFEQALIDLGLDTAPLNGYVLRGEISTVSGLSLSDKNISDLTGIEDFISLESLNCYNNSLTSLDLRANTFLQGLSCYNNSLTSLDVSANTLLERLYCYNNSLTSLDVSANTLLETLSCGDNNLTSIDVSANTLLETLSCWNNSLTSLDVSANTSLRTLLCNDNNLTSLDVSNGNNVIDDRLSFLFDATNNPVLSCVQVDDVAYSTSNWLNIDTTASFSTDCSVTLSVHEVALSNVKLYPNPVSNFLKIESASPIENTSVINLQGVTLYKGIRNIIDFSNLPSGIYIVKIKTNSGEIHKRILKKQTY